MGRKTMQRMGMVIGPAADEFGVRVQRPTGSGAGLPLQQWQLLHLIESSAHLASTRSKRAKRVNGGR
ncbi:hypothetical protein BS630_27990 [Rhizobium laguerreae]|nr:hypothetical protein BS630_27990 [Rhizobium laguerreae]